MKIMLVNTVYGKGSVGRICSDLYEELERSGDMPFAATGRGRLPAGIRGCTIGNPADFAAHVLKNFFQDGSGFGSEKVTRRFLSLLDKTAPDLIHLHNIHGFFLQTKLLFEYLKKSGIPVIWTLHDCWPYTGHCAYYDHIQPRAGRSLKQEKSDGLQDTGAGHLRCTRWITGCHDCPIHRTAYPYALFKDNSKINWEIKKLSYTGVPNLTLVTPSKWLAGQVKQSFLGDYPVVVLPNGIDLNIFKPAGDIATSEEKTQKTVLGVANIWEERKGLKYFERLAESLPDNFRMVIVGLNKSQVKHFERKYSKNRVLPITRTESTDELAKLYREADVFVNASLEDNFPTTNLEALACGTPVVTFNTGGSAESLSDECGIVVPKGDFNALKAAAERVCLSHPFEASVCREQSLRYSKKEFSRKYMELYRVVCDVDPALMYN